MSHFYPQADRAPSTLWMWGFWIYVGAAVAVFVLSIYTPRPVQLVLRCVTGVLLIIAGPHQLRVVKHKQTIRGPFGNWGPNWYRIDRQTAWTAVVVGLFFIGSALVGL